MFAALAPSAPLLQKPDTHLLQEPDIVQGKCKSIQLIRVEEDTGLLPGMIAQQVVPALPRGPHGFFHDFVQVCTPEGLHT
jgi:hypothetical protein